MRISAIILSLAVAFPVLADTVKLKDDAPDRHVVVKGDTLWDISAKFLNTPWKWPELWQLNKAEIKNPHLIYPGDVVVLIMTADGPRLSVIPTVKLTPRVRSEPLRSEADAIPSIPAEAVAPFIAQAGVIDPERVANMPRVLGTDDKRVFMATGDTVYATAGDGFTTKWHIVRPGGDLIDPDSGAYLGKEAIHVADASTVVEGSPQTLRIERSVMEINKGDRLIPAAATELATMVPRSPDKVIDGKIISAYGGVNATARHANVVINKGRGDGLEPGHVLAIYRTGRTVGGLAPKTASKHRASDLELQRPETVEYKNFWEEALDFLDPFNFFFKPYADGRRGWRYIDGKCLKDGAKVSADATYEPTAELVDCTPENAKAKWAYMDIGCLKHGKSVTYDQPFDPKEVYQPHCRPEAVVKLPDVRTGLALVYRVFDKVSYALVMESSGPIYLLDNVRNP
jgi:hypothetical protein